MVVATDSHARSHLLHAPMEHGMAFMGVGKSRGTPQSLVWLQEVEQRS